VEPLDKAVIGGRIKALRKARGLRQWQMAEKLGATQPAVHKYENGILPEVKRLLELARIGSTSIEWILTGRHWENGSTEMERLAPEVYELAYQFSAFTAEERKLLGDALEIINDAAAAVRRHAGDAVRDVSEADVAHALRSFETVRGPLAAALAVYDAVVSTLAGSKVRELHGFGRGGEDHPPADGLRHPALHKNAS
jgi:transcriptional regulator with XRE-family HTH domain